MKKALLTTCLFFAFSNAAHADMSQSGAPQQWQVDYAHSKLAFMGDQNGQKFEGGFKNFVAHIALDPNHPENGSVSVTIDIASAYAGSPDRDSMLPQKEWFDSSKSPQAQFVSTAIRTTGPLKYEIDGTVTIKGVSKNVTMPFTLLQDGDHWHALGKTTLMRSDFAIGSGSYASEAYVKHAVDVVVDLQAKPQ